MRLTPNPADIFVYFVSELRLDPDGKRILQALDQIESKGQCRPGGIHRRFGNGLVLDGSQSPTGILTIPEQSLDFLSQHGQGTGLFGAYWRQRGRSKTRQVKIKRSRKMGNDSFS